MNDAIALARLSRWCAAVTGPSNNTRRPRFSVPSLDRARINKSCPHNLVDY